MRRIQLILSCCAEGAEKKERTMNTILSEKYGYGHFRIKYRNTVYKAKEFGYIWSNSYEAYILFYVSDNSRFNIALKSNSEGDKTVKKCLNLLKRRGYLDIDKII